jgi:hypothetical protein
MKRLTSLILALAALTASAQVPAKAPGPFEPVATLPVTGSMQISYRTRAQETPKPGVTDVYTVNVNVANSAVFHGTIEQLPYIANTLSSDQPGRVSYDVDLDIVNPRNVTQTRNVGKLTGYVPADKQNVYHYDAANSVKVIVFPIGAAKGFESRFNGTVLGKPPAASGFTKMKQDAVKLVSSKGGAITLTKYDKMVFQNHVLPSGPVLIYPETTVAGTAFYDYDRSAWHFNNLTLTYNADGKRAVDTLSGSIRWIEAKNRKQTGEGHYELNVYVNEPPPTESSIFAATADESAFFAASDEMPGLIGSISYKDTFAGDTVTNSAIQIDLKANHLSKAQTMALVKLLLFSLLVPLNAE